jgi:hypothetical protein
MNKKFLIIGCGNLGKRYIQALSKLKEDYSLHLVDIKFESENGIEEFQNQTGNSLNRVNYYHHLDQIDSEYSIIIVATTSTSRFEHLKFINQNIEYDHLILEKVLFQKTIDYNYALSYYCNNYTYVNHIMREYPLYKWLKSNYKIDFVEIIVKGKINLGSNSLHYIDLMLYLTDAIDYEINNQNSNIVEIESIRTGFIDYDGFIEVDSSKAKLQIISDREIEEVSLSFRINDEIVILVNETKNEICFSDKSTKTRLDFDAAPFLSDIMTDIIEGLVLTGKTELPRLYESILSHLKFIDFLLIKNKIRNDEISIT